MSRGYDNGTNNGIAFKHSSPVSMGFKHDLYALLHVGEEVMHWLEDNFFLQVDNEAAVAMRELAAGNINLEKPLRNAWARFIMAMLSRTPDKIAGIRSAYDQEVPKYREALSVAYDADMACKDPPPTPEEKAAALQRTFSIGTGKLIQSVMDLPNVGNRILQMRWAVITMTDGGRDFLTCDYPVYMSKGLQHEDAFIALPISPRKLFVASKSQAQVDGLAAWHKGELTQAINKALVVQARQYLYASGTFERNFVARNLRR